MDDRVAQTRIYREWNVPARGERDLALLDLAADVLGGGKTSRLYQRLVYQDKLVDDVSVGITPFELVSQFVLQADVKQGRRPEARSKQVIAEEWAKFLARRPDRRRTRAAPGDGPRADHPRPRARRAARASRWPRARSISAIPLRGSRTWPGTSRPSRPTCSAAAKKWLSHGDYTLTVVPTQAAPKIEDVAGLPAAANAPATPPAKPTDGFTIVKSDVDRSKGVPEVGDVSRT